MKNSDYFIEALQAQTYKKLAWVIDCFTAAEYEVFDETNQSKYYPYQLVKLKGDDNSLYFIDNIESTPTKLEEYKAGEALLRFKDELELPINALPNVSKVTKTTYGNAFFNAYVLCYAFGSKFPYVNSGFNGGRIESIIAQNLKDYDRSVDPDTRDPNFFYVDELIKHNNAASALEGLSMVSVPSVSYSTMVPTPGVLELRDKLLEKHKDDLDNPATVAEIMKQLVEHEKKHLKGGETDGFYIKGKSFDVIRMKRFIMYGLEGGFGDGKPHLITKSLSEGWDVNNFAEMVDGLRGGSYSRGAETAIGGEWVKHFQRVFQNVKVIEEDCGVKMGFDWLITDNNYNRFSGLWMLENGRSIQLTEDKVKPLIGKTITVRSPMLCKSQAPNFCEKCCGEAISANKQALHSITSEVGSVFMLVRMKQMHGNAVISKTYDYKKAIS